MSAGLDRLVDAQKRFRETKRETVAPEIAEALGEETMTVAAAVQQIERLTDALKQIAALRESSDVWDSDVCDHAFGIAEKAVGL